MHPRHNSMERVDPDEVKLAEISRHPIGIILLYLQASIGMVFAIGLCYFLLPVVLDDTNAGFYYANIFAVVSVILTFIVILIATYIYRQNLLLITDRNITQVLQYGLFNRKVSQLNMNNVEDVTAEQNGVLATMFNFGTLKIETAGEQVNFHFIYCPNAGYFAKIILDAREKMLGQMNPGLGISSVSSNDNGYKPATSAGDIAGAIKDLGAETIKQAGR